MPLIPRMPRFPFSAALLAVAAVNSYPAAPAELLTRSDLNDEDRDAAASGTIAGGGPFALPGPILARRIWQRDMAMLPR